LLLIRLLRYYSVIERRRANKLNNSEHTADPYKPIAFWISAFFEISGGNFFVKVYFLNNFCSKRCVRTCMNTNKNSNASNMSEIRKSFLIISV